MNKKLKIAIPLIFLFLLVCTIYYVNDYYHAETIATDCLNGNRSVEVIKYDNGLFLDGPGKDNALIFYPGAKVEYTSYLPLFMKLADRGIDCYLVEMPFNIAFLGQNSADEIMANSSYSHYFISGHSLGGVVAASYVNRTNKTDGLILFASYSTDKIDKPVLSIYGSEDKVLNQEKYQDSKPLMKNLTEDVIDGGNHAQFGYYGNQSGDGQARISAQNQQDQCVNDIYDFIDKTV